MSTVLCFDAAAQRRYQDRIEQSDRHAEAVAEATARLIAELRVTFLAGMAGTAVQLPFVQRGQHGRPDLERTQPLAEGVMQSLETMHVLGALLNVLTDSECPLVKTLRVELADRYAQDNAADLAELECAP